VALITSHDAGTFVVSITPTPATEVDTNSQRIVTQGTIALGREWSASWLASWGGITLIVVVPIVAGVAVLVLAWRRRGPRDRAGDQTGDRPGGVDETGHLGQESVGDDAWSRVGPPVGDPVGNPVSAPWPPQ
jgi:hypothetical protein